MDISEFLNSKFYRGLLLYIAGIAKVLIMEVVINTEVVITIAIIVVIKK